MNRAQQELLMKMQLGNVKNGGRSRQKQRDIKSEVYAGINEIVSKWKEDDMKIAVKLLCTVKSRSFDMFRMYLFPRSLDSVHAGRLVSMDCTSERLFIWYALLINQYSDKINRYNVLKDKFEKAFIDGNYGEASTIIEKVESELGFSLWGIDSRFAVYEYEGGLEKNKAFLEEIVSSDASVWVKYYADFQSFKVEKNINNRQYVHRIETAFKNNSSGIAAFFKELLYPIQNFADEDTKDILRLNFALPLIDIYNAFIKVCIRLISSGNNHYCDIIKEVFSIIDGIDDVVFLKIKWALRESDNQIRLSSSDIILYEIGDLYTRGEYEKVICKIEEMKVLNNCFEVYEYYVKAHIMANKNIIKRDADTIRNQLIESMYSAYVKQNDVEHAYFIITKLVRLFSNSYLGTQLASFFADKFWESEFPVLEKGKFLSASVNNINMVILNEDKHGEIFEIYKDCAGINASYNLFQFIINGVEPNLVDYNFIRWYRIKKDLKRNQIKAMTELEAWYEELKCINMPYAIYQKERIILQLYKLYISAKEYLKAEILVAEACIENKYAYLRLDLSLIHDAVFIKDKKWKSNICTPIVAYLHDREDFTTIYSATANFLRNNGINKPSELFGKEKFGDNKLIFFLKKVCIKEVLDSMYDTFDTDDDVENERIDICKYLQVFDKKNASNYIEEISRILQNRKVRQGVKYFEDVKIDIDFGRIFDSHKKEFHENYKRFKDMERLNVDFATYDVGKGVWVLNVGDDPQTYSHTFLAFKALFDDYRQEVTFGKFGLDTVLGARIRHGILQNQIRVVFGNNNIILVSKSTDDNNKVYVSTSELDNICCDLLIEDKQKVFNLLADFSKKVDEYIDKIVKYYIRIHIDDKNSRGVFNFSYNQDSLHALMAMAKDMQNENLVREYFDGIWLSAIEYGIKSAKDLIQGEVKSTFISMLKLLEEQMSTEVFDERVKNYFLNSISKSRTELQQSIDCISEWFKLPEEQKMENYSAQYLVETCDYINRRVVSNFDSIKITPTIDVHHMFKGKTFSYIVDILIILYTNAFYHSGYIERLSELNIDLSVVENETELIVKMRNNLCDEVDRKELSNTIKEIRSKLQECISCGEFYNYEGRSGYIKICKILNYNLECVNSYLEFGLEKDDNHYFIRIVMPKTVLVEKEEQ